MEVQELVGWNLRRLRVERKISQDDLALIAEVERAFGSLDILVLNASGGMESGMAEDYALQLNRDAQVRVLQTALPLMGDGSHHVSLDEVIVTMRETGRDMSEKYKETAMGGLAVNVIEC